MPSYPVILLVEDTAGIALILRVLLEGEGYQVIHVASVAAGVDVLRRSSVDLVLTDAFSPRPEGALASIAPLLAAVGETPIALFTAHTIPLADWRARGLCACIPKPFNFDRLLEQVRACLQDAEGLPAQAERV